jgi:hypothetical protein
VAVVSRHLTLLPQPLPSSLPPSSSRSPARDLAGAPTSPDSGRAPLGLPTRQAARCWRLGALLCWAGPLPVVRYPLVVGGAGGGGGGGMSSRGTTHHRPPLSAIPSLTSPSSPPLVEKSSKPAAPINYHWRFQLSRASKKNKVDST